MKHDGVVAGKKLKNAVEFLIKESSGISEVLKKGEVYDQVYDLEASGIYYSGDFCPDGLVHSYTWEFLLENDIERIKYEIKEHVMGSQKKGDLPVFVDKG